MFYSQEASIKKWPRRKTEMRKMRKTDCPGWKKFYFMALTDVLMCCPAAA